MSSKYNEVKIEGPEVYQNCKSLLQTSVLLCKLVTNKKVASGFCLMTNGHITKEDLVTNKESFQFYFDNEKKTREIKLDTDERYSKYILIIRKKQYTAFYIFELSNLLTTLQKNFFF